METGAAGASGAPQLLWTGQAAAAPSIVSNCRRVISGISTLLFQDERSAGSYSVQFDRGLASLFENLDLLSRLFGRQNFRALEAPRVKDSDVFDRITGIVHQMQHEPLARRIR